MLLHAAYSRCIPWAVPCAFRWLLVVLLLCRASFLLFAAASACHAASAVYLPGCCLLPCVAHLPNTTHCFTTTRLPRWAGRRPRCCCTRCLRYTLCCCASPAVLNAAAATLASGSALLCLYLALTNWRCAAAPAQFFLRLPPGRFRACAQRVLYCAAPELPALSTCSSRGLQRHATGVYVGMPRLIQ